MTPREDTYWDDLGIAWTAINPEIGVISPRLKARLRRQSLAIAAGLVVGLIVAVAGVALGAFTVWTGATTGNWNFVSRGIGITVIAVMVARAVATLLPVRAGEAARSLSDMLDLAIGRAQRTLFGVRLGLFACVTAGAFGLVGTAVRTYQTGPPRLSPVVDLLILAVFALGLVFYGRHTKVAAEKLRALKHALAAHGSK